MNNITKKYKKQVVLDNVSAKIYQGDRIGVIGPNGGGKTTIAEIISRIKQPTSGTVKYTNPKIRVGIQFQDTNYPRAIQCRAIIRYYVDAYKLNVKKKKLDDLIKYFELDDLLKKSVNSLSGGQKQRLNILLSLMHDPDFVVLDELTTGLDIAAKDKMHHIVHQKILNQKDKSLLLVSHSIGEVSNICNRIWFIYNKGIYINKTLREILSKHKSLEDYVEKIFLAIKQNPRDPIYFNALAKEGN